MRQLSADGQQMIHDVAQRHGFSDDGVLSMLQSVINGNGSMAQFSHPDFAGAGQWMRGGMTMVSDMFNNQLKGRVDSLCSELSNLVANEPNLLVSGSFQSQNQGQQPDYHRNFQSSSMGGSQHQQQGNFGMGSGASLFVPATRENTGQWWPEELGQPSSTGAQNEVRYAYFPQARRLAINVNGRISVYDTQDHQIGGFSQQQSGGASVTLTSQYGLVSLFNLPIVSGESLVTPASPLPPPAQVSAATSETSGSQGSRVSDTSNTDNLDVFATIEKLASLLKKGYISPEEFAEKKKELLSRL
jgi:hypothetical protein